MSESGKPLAEAYAHELVVGADACRWHAANLGRRASRRAARLPAARASTEAWLAPVRAARRGRDRHALELPARDTAAPGRGRRRDRERRRPEAVRADAADGRVGRGALPPGRRACGPRSGRAGRRRDHRRRARPTPRHRRGRVHGLRRGRSTRGAGGGRAALPGRPRARREGRDARPRRRRPRPCRRGCAVGHVHELRSGMRGDRADRRAAGPARHVRRAPHGRGPRPPDRARVGRRRRARAARQRGAARPVREPRRGRGRARGDRRGRRTPTRRRSPGLVLRADDPRRRAARRAPAGARSSSVPPPSLSKWTTTTRWCAG